MSARRDIWQDLSSCGPTLTPSVLGPHLWHWLASMPPDYRAFLMDHNGGWLPTGKYSFTVEIPYRGKHSQQPTSDCNVTKFFPIQPGTDRHSSDDLKEWNAYIHEMGSLPADAIAIADCDGSLVCLSLRPREFGAVYYWEYYADYPWHEDFFRERRRDVMKNFKDAGAIVSDGAHLEFEALSHDLLWARLVRLAGSFNEWAASLKGRPED